MIDPFWCCRALGGDRNQYYIFYSPVTLLATGRICDLPGRRPRRARGRRPGHQNPRHTDRQGPDFAGQTHWTLILEEPTPAGETAGGFPQWAAGRPGNDLETVIGNVTELSMALHTTTLRRPSRKARS